LDQHENEFVGLIVQDHKRAVRRVEHFERLDKNLLQQRQKLLIAGEGFGGNGQIVQNLNELTQIPQLFLKSLVLLKQASIFPPHDGHRIHYHRSNLRPDSPSLTPNYNPILIWHEWVISTGVGGWSILF